MRRDALRFVLIALPVWVAAMILYVSFETTYLERFMPLVGRMIETLAPVARAEYAGVDDQKRAIMKIRHGTYRLSPGGPPSSVAFYSVPKGMISYPPILVATLLAAWPWLTWWRRLAAMILAIPLTLGASSLDLALAYLGPFLAVYNPGPPTWGEWLCDIWFKAHAAGGSLFLSILVALAAVGIVTALVGTGREPAPQASPEAPPDVGPHDAGPADSPADRGTTSAPDAGAALASPADRHATSGPPGSE